MSRKYLDENVFDQSWPKAPKMEAGLPALPRTDITDPHLGITQQRNRIHRVENRKGEPDNGVIDTSSALVNANLSKDVELLAGKHPVRVVDIQMRQIRVGCSRCGKYHPQASYQHQGDSHPPS